MRTVLDEASAIGLMSDLLNFAKDNSAIFKKLGSMASSMRSGSKIDNSNKSNYFLGGSISRYSKDLIMTFPTLIDNSLSPETASMISKANERNIVSMIQMLFASMQLRGTDGREIIRQIYGDDRKLGGWSYDDYVDSLTNVYNMTREDVNVLEDAMRDVARQMEAQLKQPMKNFPTDSFSNNSLNDYSVIDINGVKKVKFAPVKEAKYGDPDPEVLKILSQGGYKRDKYGFFYTPDPRDIGTSKKGIVDYENDLISRRAQIDNFDRQQNLNQNKFDYQKNRDTKEDEYRMRFDYAQKQADTLSKQLLDSDIKKANEIQPSMIVVSFSETDKDKDGHEHIIDTRSFIVGVKSRLISVDSSDMVDRIVAKNTTRVNFLNFIRATTGEINFMKDFIFCLKQAKIDAKNSIKRGEAANMWKTLENLSVKNKRNNLRKAGNDASAITTLVLNQETVNLIRKQHEIDLNNVATVRQIMSDYNLLGIIIADESIEAVKFLYDGNDMFETQAYSFLEKENADKSYKKIINLMSQNRRF